MSALTLFEHPAPPAPRIRDGGVLATRLAGKHGALITGHFVLPGREGRFAALPDDLPPALATALRSRGVSQLYISLADPAPDGGVTVRIYHKPLVLLIWFGPVLMAFGGALSLSDRRLRVGAPKPAKALRGLQAAE